MKRRDSATRITASSPQLVPNAREGALMTRKTRTPGDPDPATATESPTTDDAPVAVPSDVLPHPDTIDAKTITSAKLSSHGWVCPDWTGRKQPGQA